MHKLLPLICSLLFVQVYGQPAGPAAQHLIQHASVVDPAAGRLIENQDLWIRGGSIEAVGASGSLDVPAGTDTLDATGQYLCPGWTDAHIHYFQTGGLYTRPDALDLRAIRPYDQEIIATRALAPDMMRRYLAAGVTTVCDVGGPMTNFDIRAQSDTLAAAPATYVAGPLLSTYVPQALQVEDPPIKLIESPEAARAEVQRQAALQPDFIKIWFIVFPGQSPADHQDWISVAIAASHEAGIPVAVHATQLETARLAVQLGADILVHSVDDQQIDAEFVTLLLANQVSYVPTLVVSSNYDATFRGEETFTHADFTLANPFTLGSLMDLNHLPPQPSTSWLERFRQMPDNRPEQAATMAYNLKTLFEAGVNVVTGTDAGNIGTLHASSYYAETAAMAAAGLSPAQILRASTTHAARMLGRQGRMGSVTPGADADLLLLRVNPLEQLPGPDDILRVYRAGQAFIPTELIPSDPITMAQRQLNAYNARNLEEFVACYAPEVEIYTHPDVLRATGWEQMREMYRGMFEQVEGLHCELVNRIDMNGFVIDREKVRGFGPGVVVDAVAMYEVADGLIQKVYFLPRN